MKEFVEIQSWGFNAVVVSSALTMIFTLIQGYGFIKQSEKIWKEKSVASISAPFFFLFFFFFIAFLLYGWYNRSLAMMFNGLLFVTCLPIIIGIFKFSCLSFYDKAAFILSAAVVPLMVILEEKDILLGAMFLISLFVLRGQVVAIYRAKSVGAVEPKMMAILLFTSIFWFLYSALIINWPILLFNFFGMMLYGLMLFYCFKYKKQEALS